MNIYVVFMPRYTYLGLKYEYKIVLNIVKKNLSIYIYDANKNI